MRKNQNSEGNFERRAQTIVQGLIALGVSWIGFNIVDMGKSIVALQVQGIQTTGSITEIKAEFASSKAQVAAAALAANTAATAATTAAALAATAATTAAALAARSEQPKPAR